VLIANHLSYVDVVVLQLACPRPIRYLGHEGLPRLDGLAGTVGGVGRQVTARDPVRVLRAGREPTFILSGGGADANVFNERGLQCVNLANGMTDIHTPDERIAVADLEEMVEVTLALVDSAREVEHAA